MNPIDLQEIEALEAEAIAEEAAAARATLSEETQRAADAIARRQKAREERGAKEKAERSVDLARREKKVRTVLGPSVLVKGIDLIDLFPLGEAPPLAQIPGGGILIVRFNSEAMQTWYTEAEAKVRSMPTLYADLLASCAVNEDNPTKDLEPAAGVLLRRFCEAYPSASIGAGDIVAKMGGSKLKADKRGRA